MTKKISWRDGAVDGKRMLLSQDRRVALGDLLYAVEILSDHIRQDPRARSVYERFMSSAVLDRAKKAVAQVNEHFNLKDDGDA